VVNDFYTRIFAEIKRQKEKVKSKKAEGKKENGGEVSGI